MFRLYLSSKCFPRYRKLLDTSFVIRKSCLSSSRHDSADINQLLNDMPKMVDRDRSQRKRQLFRQVAVDKNRPPAEVCLQVLGNGSRGSPKCLYVFTDQHKYLFNCGEGTQRLAHEHKTKLAKLEHIFFTHRSWSNIGGLPGLILTIQAIGVAEITLHGPRKIEELFDMTKGFMLTDGIKIVKREVEEGSHSDHIMSVKYVPFFGSSIARCEGGEDAAVIAKESLDNNATTKTDGSPSRASKRQKLSDDEKEERDTSVAYICKLTKKPGQLLLERCVELGVKPGPLLGQLKDGKDVTLEDGTLVKASDVLMPEDPRPVFIVVDCPTSDFLDSLLASDAFAAHQSSAECPEDIATLVVHFSSAEVVQTDKYQSWMKRFHPNTEHLMVNDSNLGPGSKAVHRIQHKLHQLDPNIFPLLGEHLSNDVFAESIDGLKIVAGETMLKYYLRPLRMVDRSSVVAVDVQEFLNELASLPEFVATLSRLKSESNEPSPLAECSSYPEIIFLGTGSAIPSKDRNTSGILLNISSEKSMILDCGEGTLIQLCRFYGSKVDSVLRKVVAIYVSHMHADHHLGLIELLKHRRNAVSKSSEEFRPVALLAPYPIMKWLQKYSDTFEPITDDFRLYENSSFFPSSGKKDSLISSQMIQSLDFKKLECTYVKHCSNAFGIAITHKDNWKLVYSGDTMPCDDLVTLGKDCDVLIHEATMEDDLENEAIVKRHSTTTQAIEQGIKMNAKFTLLTHFSQRYAKIPLYNDSFNDKVGIVFDNTKLALDSLHRLPRLLPALKAMFAEHYKDMTDKTTKKLVQRKMDEIKAKNV